MNIQNISIRTSLLGGLGIILLFVILLGALAYHQSIRLWQNTEDLYDHPFYVLQATHEIKADINDMHLLMKDISLNKDLSQKEFKDAVSRIDAYEVEVYKLFESVYSRYLGPRSDIDCAFNYFRNWKSLRDGVIRLKQNGDFTAAYTSYKTRNVYYRNNMIANLDVMIDFASNKSISFYKAAEREKNSLLLRQGIFLIGILVLALLGGYALYLRIRSPLLALTLVTDSYRKGNYDVRSVYNSTNEIGILASAFNTMAASVQEEIATKENVAWISQLLMKVNELKPFCTELLKALIAKTDSHVAAIYFLNNEKTQFEHYESIGMAAENCRPFSALTSEGEFGAVLMQKKMVRIARIQPDTVFSFPAVAGKFLPREIITIPILKSETVVAVVSLASLGEFSSPSVKLLTEIEHTLTARLHGLLAFQEITEILIRLDRQNRELEDKSRELKMQAEELNEYNIELTLQKKLVDEASHFKSAFLSNMSHELRTPLNSVIALSGVLNRQLKDKIPEEDYSFLKIIERNGKQLLLLINDILDLSRIEAGKEELNFSTFNMNALLQAIEESVAPAAAERGISIVDQISLNLPEITSDSAKCYHILQNIINNAVKFTEKGSVEIHTAFTENEIHISVKDTGIGIAEEQLPFIFDEFRQADDKASRKYGGTGLGLAIAKKYTHMLQGSIEVQSQPGVGSTFTIKLPISYIAEVGHANETGSGNTPPSLEIRGNPVLIPGMVKSILLVEDCEEQIIQLSYIFKKSGYNVRVARNGKEALDAIGISIPDAMILDLMLPVVNGFEVLATIRNMEEASHIPIIVLTARHISKKELGFLRENQIHQIVLKGGVNRTELIAMVRNMVYPVENGMLKSRKGKVKNKAKPAILVIEDNPDSFKSLNALLAESYNLIAAADGSEGIEKAGAVKPDLILLDISLPGKDGFVVFDEIRKNEKLNNVPVIAFTARAMKGDKEEILAYGFDDYISKPVDYDSLKQLLNKWLCEISCDWDISNH